LRLPFENRGLTSGFSAGNPATLQLQLRAFFGVCSRAEIMLTLIMDNSASISEIATGSYYSWKSIQDALFEMALSGLVTHPLSKRERRYSLADESWRSLFLTASKKPFENINWCTFFSAMEILWQALESKKFSSLPLQTAGIELASLVESRLQNLLLAADSRIRIPDYRNAGENYCKAFTAAVTTALSRL